MANALEKRHLGYFELDRENTKNVWKGEKNLEWEFFEFSNNLLLLKSLY